MTSYTAPFLRVAADGAPKFHTIVFGSTHHNGSVALSGALPQSDTDLVREFVNSVNRDNYPKGRFFIESVLEHGDDVIVRGRRWRFGDIRAALEGRPDEELPPLPTVKTVLDHRRNVKYNGFADFNGGPHLCIEIPDGPFTISCKTSEGKLITFAFCPYKDGGPPQCVDIQHHTSGVTKMNSTMECPVQEVIAFTTGQSLFRSKLDDEKPCTLMTLLLATKAEQEAAKK